MSTKKKNFELYDDRVLIEPGAAEEKTAGGIIIPDTAKEKPAKGVIVGIGTGKWEKGELVPVRQKLGDHVLYGKYAGTEVKIDGKEYLLMRTSDLFMKDPEAQ